MSGAVAASFGNRFKGQPNYIPQVSLVTPTYDGSGVTTEPTWIAKPSWVTATGTDLLAHNPLTGGSDEVENPSLLISNDQGASWSTPPGLTNPIAPKPTAAGQPGHNADCFLVNDVQTQRLIMFWIVVSDPTVVSGANQNGVWYSTCSDPSLATWSARALLFNHNGVNAQQMASVNEQEPKYVWDPTRNRWVMFTQDSLTQAVRVRVSTSTNILGTYGSPVTASIPINGGETLWHMDVIRESTGRWIMVLCDNRQVSGSYVRRAWLASSADGINWKVAPRPFMGPDDGTWAVGGAYRPSIIRARSGPGYDVIVARVQTPNSRLGLARNIPATEIP